MFLRVIMAQQGLKPDEEKHCSACSDLLKDPVVIPCGHSVCVSCIKSHCDEENPEETHSCPQCRQVFMEGTTQLKDLVEQPKKTRPVLDKRQESPTEDQTKVTPTVDTLQPEEEPRTRAEFLKYSCEITLDPNTASPHLILSDGNRKAVKVDENQAYPIHPDRFMDGCQVLSKESLTGRHYWEVERSGSISVAVSYKDISKTGTESVFGCNYKSWALDCFHNRYKVRNFLIQAARPYALSSRVGVYLDHGAGILSFYSISETMKLLHRYQTTFTGPLYAGLWVHGDQSVAVVYSGASL